MVQPEGTIAADLQAECADACDIHHASPGSIHIAQSMKIDEPSEAPICRKSGETQIKMLVVPDSDSGQKLIIFQLPKDNVSCTVQHLLTMLKSQLHEEEIDSTYLVKDPVHNVRYVVTVRTKTNCDTQDDKSSTSHLSSNTSTNESCASSKKSRKRKRNSSESSYSYSTKSNDIIEVKCPSTDQRLTLDFRRNAQVIVIYPKPPNKHGYTITIEDFKCLAQNEYLNDIIIDFYLKYLFLEKLPIQHQKRTYVFNTFFYTKLSNSKCTLSNANLSMAAVQHTEVRRWTKNVNIFEKDFIIVPINQNQHWFLAVICYPALIGMEVDKKKSDFSEELRHYPCIIIFDSLHSFTIERPKVITDLKNYLECEYNERTGGNSLFFDDMEVVYADVPQQFNSSDCGLYLLQFAENFLKDFVIKSSLKLLKKPLNHWFGPNVIRNKREELKKLIIQLAMSSKVTKKPYYVH